MRLVWVLAAAVSLHVVAYGQEAFIRGDANLDGTLDISDAYVLPNWLFLGGPPPGCKDSADANDDGALDISDPQYTLGFLFVGSNGPPPAPYPDPGLDPTTADSLDCATPLPPTQNFALVDTDPDALVHLTFENVMDKIVATSGVATTSLQLYQSWWAQLDGIGCTDFSGLGYDITCGRPEAGLASTDPFDGSGGDDTYFPVAVFNRLDLAPFDGSHCGEYRIVFAKTSGLSSLTDRNFIIVEGQLANPDTADPDLEDCTPVVDHWQDIGNASDPNARALLLKELYLDGLPGFAPVIHADHLAPGTGQIRTNTQMGALGDWMLREFKVVKTCVLTCDLEIEQVSVKGNPFAPLFDDGGHDDSDFFQSEAVFLSQVGAIADDFPSVSLPVWTNANESHATAADNDYWTHVQQGSGAFETAIQTELDDFSVGNLTPKNIVDRVTSLSCAGCHSLTAGVDLGPDRSNPTGPDLSGPVSLGFTQVSESGGLSPALLNDFLPERQAILDNFPPGDGGGGSTGPATLSGRTTH